MHGGTFGPSGWTTTSGDDYIVIPLPPGVDASRGWYSFRVQPIERSLRPGECDQFDISYLGTWPIDQREGDTNNP